MIFGVMESMRAYRRRAIQATELDVKYREAAEVPLAILGPEIPRARTDALVQLVDLFPL